MLKNIFALSQPYEASFLLMFCPGHDADISFDVLVVPNKQLVHAIIFMVEGGLGGVKAIDLQLALPRGSIDDLGGEIEHVVIVSSELVN